MPSVEEDRTVRSMEKSRALVTGADGFIGSHLVEMLVEQGRPVRALCFYNSFNSWGWLDDSPVRDQIEIVTGDIRADTLIIGASGNIKGEITANKVRIHGKTIGQINAKSAPRTCCRGAYVRTTKLSSQEPRHPCSHYQINE